MCHCPHGASVEHHRLWQCSWMLSQLQSPVPPSWSPLNSHVSSQRSFWHQLLVPSSYTSLLPADEEHVEVDRVLEPLHLCVEGLQLCTDGSGGPFTSDPRQRRCSYSIVALRRVLTHRSVSVGTLLLSLAPSRQFQELMAVPKALHLTVGDLEVASDADHVHRGFRKLCRSRI